MTTPRPTWDNIHKHLNWDKIYIEPPLVDWDVPHRHYVMGEIRDLREMRNDPNIDLKIKAYIGGGILLLVTAVAGLAVVSSLLKDDIRIIVLCEGGILALIMGVGGGCLVRIGIDNYRDLKKVRADTNNEFLQSLIEKSQAEAASRRQRRHEMDDLI